MSNFEELNSDRAIVCKTEVVNSQGVGIIWYVCMADGHLLECGVGQKGRDRAGNVAEKLNS